jgi:hypothetical protein
MVMAPSPILTIKFKFPKSQIPERKVNLTDYLDGRSVKSNSTTYYWEVPIFDVCGESIRIGQKIIVTLTPALPGGRSRMMELTGDTEGRGELTCLFDGIGIVFLYIIFIGLTVTAAALSTCCGAIPAFAIMGGFLMRTTTDKTIFIAVQGITVLMTLLSLVLITSIAMWLQMVAIFLPTVLLCAANACVVRLTPVGEIASLPRLTHIVLWVLGWITLILSIINRLEFNPYYVPMAQVYASVVFGVLTVAANITSATLTVARRDEYRKRFMVNILPSSAPAGGDIDV